MIRDVKCAVVLAKRWQSAAHCSTDSVAGRVKQCYQSGVINPLPQPGTLTADPQIRPLDALEFSSLLSELWLLLAAFVITTQPAD